MASKATAVRKVLTAVMTPDQRDAEGHVYQGSLVVVCDDGAVFIYSREEGQWHEMAPVPGSRREPIKTREDAIRTAHAEKVLREGLDAFQKREAAKKATRKG
jgi:hypothetical protein